MFLFQVSAKPCAPLKNSGAEMDGAGLENVKGINSATSQLLRSFFSDPNAVITVIDNDGVKHEWTRKEAGQHIKALLNAMQDEDLFSFLKRAMALDDDGLFQVLKSKMPWLDEKSLNEIKAGSNPDFRKIFAQMCSNATFIKSMLRASIITSNVGNDGQSLNHLGLEETLANTASTFIIMSLALSTSKQAANSAVSIKAAGKIGDLVGFEIDPKRPDHICSYVNAAYMAASCLVFDKASAVYLGQTPEEADAGIIQAGIKGSEKKATFLMGREYAAAVLFLAEKCINELFSRLSGAQDTFSSFIISQLQMQNDIDDMKENSEFVRDISEAEQKKRDARGGFT